ncbi:alpha/beta hydrolase, partial [Actinoalloteichus caeruleus]
MGRLRSLFGTVVVAAAAVGSSSALDATPAGDLVAPPPGTVEWAAERTEAGDRTPAPGAGTPSEVSEFFARLDGDETDRLAREHPGVVGNLDGVPVDVRLDANERALRQALSEVEARASDGELIGERRREAADRAEVYRDLLAGDRRFLVFDPRGRGLVAEVFGDVEDADSVTVLVPGNDSDLDGFDQPMAPTRSAARAGEALFTEQRARHPEARTAVIAWSGYVSPRGLGLDAA